MPREIIAGVKPECKTVTAASPYHLYLQYVRSVSYFFHMYVRFDLINIIYVHIINNTLSAT
jgi:hypothetical protein